MIEITDKKMCSGCHACYSVCPQNCIDMIKDDEGFLYPLVDKDRCIKCGACIRACHILNPYEMDNNPTAYAAYLSDENIRQNSSSGGLFTPLSEYILSLGGVVFGAVFDDKFNVNHSCIEKKEDLEKLRGSKYVQSIIGETHKQAEEFLKQGRKVLFSGTPCQTAGLKFYLKKEYENLYLIDIICHGVPSPKIWEEYLKLTEDKNNDKVKKISFRDKTKGWRKFSMVFDFKTKKRQLKTLDDDRYMYGFLRNIYLRPSCYACVEKSLHRKTDLTIADYWGIENVHSEFSDDKGISLVFVNSEKGDKLFSKINDSVIKIDTDIKKAASYNTAATSSAKPNDNRDAFFNELNVIPFNKLMDKYCQDDFSIRVIGKFELIVRKLESGVKLLIRKLSYRA